MNATFAAWLFYAAAGGGDIVLQPVPFGSEADCNTHAELLYKMSKAASIYPTLRGICVPAKGLITVPQ